MEHTDISVIIPTRNRAAWLPRCLAHLEQQTFPSGRFEVLVVDDGSTDDTQSVLHRYASGAPVCIRPLAQPPSGLAAARNLGVQHAIGERLLFLGDDELVSPRLLAQHFEAARPDQCTMGDIHQHPQLPHDTFTRLYLDRPVLWKSHEGPTHFLDWRTSNFSLARDTFLAVGALATDEELESVDVWDLAFRLVAAGILPHYLPDARAYVWQPTRFDVERRRHYRLGYGLGHLQQRTEEATIPRHFRLTLSWPEKLMNALTMASYIRACNRLAMENGMQSSGFYKRVLNYDRAAGYEDACQERPACPPGKA